MKWALVHLGSDIVYGLTYFAGELIKNNEKIHWFDGDIDRKEFLNQIKSFSPDYVCFGPLSSEFAQAATIASDIKKSIPTLIVFGGHHVRIFTEELDNHSSIDYIVWGPCYNVIDKLLEKPGRCVIKGSPVNPTLMNPALEEYYTQVPRIGRRPRKYIMSHFGCIYNCSYCCTNITRKAFGGKIYKECWLTRRPVENVIKEAQILKKFNTTEIGFNDDDVLHSTRPGQEGTRWLKEFAKRWKEEIGVEMYANVTPNTVISAEEDALKAVASLVKTVQMGFQTIDEGSRKIFNRRFQTEDQVNKACDRLISLGVKVKLETIIGLPNIDNLVPDPVADALHTIRACQRIARRHPGKIKAQCNSLILFPGTDLWNNCRKHDIKTRDAWKNSLYEGIGSVVFDDKTENRIRNLNKMITMIVKYGISEEWILALVDMKMTDDARLKFSQNQYLDSLTFRVGEHMRGKLNQILKDMTFKY